jgi:hypothetical protein
MRAEGMRYLPHFGVLYIPVGTHGQGSLEARQKSNPEAIRAALTIQKLPYMTRIG